MTEMAFQPMFMRGVRTFRRFNYRLQGKWRSPGVESLLDEPKLLATEWLGPWGDNGAGVARAPPLRGEGRFGVLLAIDPDSPEQFLKWVDGKVPWDKFGGDHPWEIKRGGNTTRIDLYVHRVENYRRYATDKEREEAEVSNKVIVGLRGHHIGRIVETVKMFLALHEAGLSIWIEDAASVRNGFHANTGFTRTCATIAQFWSAAIWPGSSSVRKSRSRGWAFRSSRIPCPS